MNTISVSRDIAATPAQVWKVITDLEGSPSTISAIESIELLSDGPFGVGTTWRETRTMFGKQASEVMTISAVEAERSYSTVAESHGARYESSFTLEPIESGTRLTFDFSGEPTSTAARIIGVVTWPLMKRATAKASAKDLDDIAAAAEAAAAD